MSSNLNHLWILRRFWIRNFQIIKISKKKLQSSWYHLGKSMLSSLRSESKTVIRKSEFDTFNI